MPGLAAMPPSFYGGMANTLLALPRTVKTAREADNLPIEVAARHMHITPTTLANFEAGRNIPSQKTIIYILRWLAAR